MTDLEKRISERVEQVYPTLTDNFPTHAFSKKGLINCLIKFIEPETELLSKHLLEMQKTNGALTDRVNELNKLFADCDTCRRTCDIGNCCKFGSEYSPDTEKVLNKNNQLIEAKKIIREFISLLHRPRTALGVNDLEAKAEAFLKE